MKVIIYDQPGIQSMTIDTIAAPIEIVTDSGTVYRIVESEPDVLRIELADDNLHMTLFPVNPNTIEVT